jgi:hypothetical protein
MRFSQHQAETNAPIVGIWLNPVSPPDAAMQIPIVVATATEAPRVPLLGRVVAHDSFPQRLCHRRRADVEARQLNGSATGTVTEGVRRTRGRRHPRQQQLVGPGMTIPGRASRFHHPNHVSARAGDAASTFSIRARTSLPDGPPTDRTQGAADGGAAEQPEAADGARPVGTPPLIWVSGGATSQCIPSESCTACRPLHPET